ncbi:peptidoglycan D,D-transpeptidase FtsI family protein [Sanguibacter suaedae]|nr:penicillin-binding protein 2 [Sanguibacter suaedae]
MQVLSVIALLVLTLFSGRLVYVQGFEAEALAADARTMRTDTVEIPAVRGEIVDVNGEVLATSVTRHHIIADPVAIATWKHSVDGTVLGGPTEAARLLAPVLGIPEAELAAMMDGERRYKRLKLDVPPETWDAVRALNIGGISAETFLKRTYPAGTTGGNLVGFVGNEGSGQAGLEASLDDLLAGSAGSTTYERGKKGHVIPSGEQSTVPAVPGSDVQVTTDTDLQWMAEARLAEQLEATGGTGGFVVVLDTRTQAVLALADSGSIDPNNPSGMGGTKSISNVFDPGSTAKIITMAAAIETGLATPTDQFEVPDRYTTANGQTFKDSHDHDVENLTLTGILAQSSNTGTLMVGQHIPKQVRHDYLTKFGFGQPTGIELAGESRGILADADDWDGRTEYAVMFGQSVSVTALQATSVFATMANGGVRTTPHLVAGTTAPDGEFVPSELPAPQQVVSEATADQVLKMMESAVTDGTGAKAAISGYRVAGKTGTAQTPDANGDLTNHLASFIGVAPVDAPRVAVGVFIENPKTSIYGGEVAAPVFADVTAFALQQLGVEPTGSAPDLYPTTW